jgi:hypothetical protein
VIVNGVTAITVAGMLAPFRAGIPNRLFDAGMSAPFFRSHMSTCSVEDDVLSSWML